MNRYHKLLNEFWGHENFRPLQEEIIKTIVETQNDVLTILPTGGGKSICYQVSGLAMQGVCLVISPLIALMKDQVLQLKKRGIEAQAIYSGMHRVEIKNTLDLAIRNKIKFLYVSPERLTTELFLDYLQDMKVCLVAVDEAHCVAQWGHDFRPAYLEIKQLRSHLKQIPILALTASATQEVKEEIIEHLTLKNVQIFQQSYSRPELAYRVFELSDKSFKLIQILKKINASSLVYCSSRKKCEEIVHILRANHLNADYYHAGLSASERNKKQDDWMKNKLNIMVCTNAFGMGIDKADVRLVVHYQIPSSIESYYQEAGRAGRDRKKAFAVALFHENDFVEIKKQIVEKYSSMTILKKVYAALNNYYKIALGKGQYISFEYQVEKILPLLKDLTIHQIIGAIEILKQFNLISIIDTIKTPAKIWICCNKTYYYEFQKNVPALFNLMNYLVRNIPNIWLEPVPVFIEQLSKDLSLNTSEINRKIAILENAKVIHFYPAIENPQIVFLINRITHIEEYIDIKKLTKSKEKELNRLDHLKSLMDEKSICRSQIIALYFGEKAPPICNNCDVCVNKKRIDLELLLTQTKQFLKQESLTTTELIQKMNNHSEEKIIEGFNLLIKEGVLIYDKNGKLQLV